MGPADRYESRRLGVRDWDQGSGCPGKLEELARRLKNYLLELVASLGEGVIVHEVSYRAALSGSRALHHESHKRWEVAESISPKPAELACKILSASSLLANHNFVS